MRHGRHEERFGAEPLDPVDERVIVFPCVAKGRAGVIDQGRHLDPVVGCI